MLKQIEVILEAATVAGCQALVLSAFGCGAYGHPPAVVAQLFRAAILERGGTIKRIYFCIINDHNAGRAHNPEGNLKPFLKAFAEGKPAEDPQQSAAGKERCAPARSSLTGGIPECVREAAAACGVDEWTVRREKRESANRRGEACAHWWWRFSRPDGTAVGSADGPPCGQ